MTDEQIHELLDLLVANESAPFTIQFGYVQEIVYHDGVLITNAPTTVLKATMAWCMGQVEPTPVFPSITLGGLLVR